MQINFFKDSKCNLYKYDLIRHRINKFKIKRINCTNTIFKSSKYNLNRNVYANL